MNEGGGGWREERTGEGYRTFNNSLRDGQGLAHADRRTNREHRARSKTVCFRADCVSSCELAPVENQHMSPGTVRLHQRTDSTDNRAQHLLLKPRQKKKKDRFRGLVFPTLSLSRSKLSCSPRHNIKNLLSLGQFCRRIVDYSDP